ncbi:MAG TPA: LptF/LptG family permease [Pyrinomonadaceae bacterium]|nr:LptF/LptG family permease [Pyrinomonadaceae bacterium]
MRSRRLIIDYIARAAFPYVLLTLALLTAILFVQQASRFAELALYAQIPLALLTELGAAFLPNVLVLSLPTAVLAGIIVGYARMGSDSEIVAMRAAGVGTWTMLWPVLVIGLIVTLATTYIQLVEAPRAARDLKRAAVEAALRKLESPVEPRTFNTEIPGYIIYVRDGDKATGSWGRVFLYTQQPDKSVRVVTARSGRIDSSGNVSELVLRDAVATKLPSPTETDRNSFVVERLDQLRISINTGRAELMSQLKGNDGEPDEMNWRELRTQISTTTGPKQAAAQRTFHRRLALSISPLVFALLGGALGLRVRRGGKGIGVLLAIAILVVYYLISLMGESLSRSGTLPVFIGAWAATGLMIFLSFVFLVLRRTPSISLRFARKETERVEKSTHHGPAGTVGVARSGFPSLLDVDLLRSLSSSFVLTFIALVSIFIIFTLFELWRFIATNRVGISLVARYVLYLLPLIAVEIFPASMLVAALLTYALLARRNETIAWWASGQSVYRLMVPGLMFAVTAALGTWFIQEHLMPKSNVRQDSLRAQIKGGEARAMTGTGRQWLASAESNRLYSYEFNEQSSTLEQPTIYEFDNEGVHPTIITAASEGKWNSANRLALRDAEVLRFQGMKLERHLAEQIDVTIEPVTVFKPTIDKPSQLSAAGLKDYVTAAKRRGVQVSALAVALQRKYAAPFSVIVMAFIGIPLALSFGRRGTVVALCAAVGLSIAYWGVGGGLQQLGNLGLLPPAVAGWAPPVIFAAAGSYLLSRIRT